MSNDVERGDLVGVEELPYVLGRGFVGVMLVVGDVDTRAGEGAADSRCCRGC